MALVFGFATPKIKTKQVPAGVTVVWNGSAFPATQVTLTQITLTIPGGDYRTTSVSGINPAPVGASNELVLALKTAYLPFVSR